MNKGTLKKLHAEWEQTTMPADAPAIQRKECKRAFYAGCFALLMTQMTTVADPATTEEEGMGLLDGVMDECQAFFDDIAKGKA
mgnify:CR=1 FL=1